MVRDLTGGSVAKLLLQFAFPLFVSNALQAVYNIVDMIVVGQYIGGTGMSAVSIGGDILHLLTFVPADESVREASFGFSCGDYAGGSVIACHIRIAETSNEAPTVSASGGKTSVTTQKGVAVYGTLESTDSENDELTYIVTSYPKNGTLTIIDKNSGKFCYEPEEDYCGKDISSHQAVV